MSARSRTFAAVLFVLVVAGVGCSPNATTEPLSSFLTPSHVVVQHVLIGFQGTIPGKTITRTEAEAQALAANILARARAGEDFNQLVGQYTDDQIPGIYKIANRGVTPGPYEYRRDGMVQGFGDVAFSLLAGSVGIANYDARLSPFGWHIIKRLD
jgi:parvulin-like peptidyl-prolyl isomerase